MLAQNLNIGNPETLLQTLDMFSLVLKDRIWSQSGFIHTFLQHDIYNEVEIENCYFLSKYLKIYFYSYYANMNFRKLVKGREFTKSKIMNALKLIYNWLLRQTFSPIVRKHCSWRVAWIIF